MSEIVTPATGGTPESTLRSRVGTSLRRVTRGIYTTNMAAPIEAVVRRNWQVLTGILLPGAVVTDRSARRGHEDGFLFVAVPTTRTRAVELPGLTIVPRKGVPAGDGDSEIAPGLHFAGEARALVENLQPSRAVKGRPPRTLGEEGVGDWLAALAARRTDAAFRRLREEAVSWGRAHGLETEAARVNELAGAALGTRTVETKSLLLTARQQGRRYDDRRVRQFDSIAEWLAGQDPVRVGVDDAYDVGRGQTLPFWESYFSNFIEGTEFGVDEAAEIVYDGVDPVRRPADAHDVRSIFLIASDLTRRTLTAQSPDDFLAILRSLHADVMKVRADKLPGEFKDRPNFNGATQFVDPALVEGTLIEGWARISSLDEPFGRAVLAMYVVSEVHPFLDGNGRIARLMMNAELSAEGMQRIVVPTAFRDNYLAALRALTHQNRPDALFDVLAWAQRYTSEIDFADLATAEEMLRQTNAFTTPAELDDGAPKLVMPSQLDDVNRV
jgi:fido (protein-threonine AMPylation protein)